MHKVALKFFVYEPPKRLRVWLGQTYVHGFASYVYVLTSLLTSKSDFLGRLSTLSANDALSH